MTARESRLQLRQALVARRDDQVAADQRVRLARGDPRRVQRLRAARHAHMRGDGAVFLAQAGEVEIGAEKPVEIGRDGRASG